MSLPRLLVIATGGTIAGSAPSAERTQGYVSAALPAAALLRTVSGLDALADIRVEEPFSIGSEQITTAHWLTLWTRMRAAAVDPSVDAVVITHGTDTMEETALLIDLTCPRDKPIILTGAMRPATALGAEGPMNLYAAAATAVDPSARGGGVMVLMNDQVFSPQHVRKRHTARVDAFGAGDGAALAEISEGHPVWRIHPAQAAAARPSLAANFARVPDGLPRVDLIAQHVDADPGLVDWLVARGARGLVVAGTGHGTLSEPMHRALADAASLGVLVVRASRLAGGPVMRNGGGVDDDASGFVAAGWLPPHKARLVTALGLASGLDRAGIQRLIVGFR